MTKRRGSRRASTKINFTKRTIEALPKPLVETTVFDSHTPGLGLLLYPSGTRSFFHLRLANGKPRRTTIGKFPEFTVDQARGKASGLNSDLAKWKLNNFQGDDPFEKKSNPALDTLVAAYVEKKFRAIPSPREKAARSVEWQVKKYLSSWGNRRLTAIHKDDVKQLHARLGLESGPYTANRTVQLVRQLFNWAKAAGMWAGQNPASCAVEFFDEDERDRFLQPEELPRFFTALANEKNSDLRDFVNLAMWTGARRGDILSMRWEDLSIDHKRWNVPNQKTGNRYVVALTPEAIEILQNRKDRAKESPWVFPSRSKSGHIVDLKVAWKELLQRANVQGLRQHDLRRTLGSYQALENSSLTIIGKSLGHQSLSATKVYARLNLDPVRASVMAATRTMIAASKVKPPNAPKPRLVKAAGQ